MLRFIIYKCWVLLRLIIWMSCDQKTIRTQLLATNTKIITIQNGKLVNNRILMNISWHRTTAIPRMKWWNDEERRALECWIENNSNMMIEECDCFIAFVAIMICKDPWSSNDVYIKTLIEIVANKKRLKMDTLSMLVHRFNGHLIPFTHFISFHFTSRHTEYQVDTKGYFHHIIWTRCIPCDRLLFICRHNKQTSGACARICYDDKRAYAAFHQIVKYFLLLWISNQTVNHSCFFFSLSIFHFISFLVNFYYYYFHSFVEIRLYRVDRHIDWHVFCLVIWSLVLSP